MSGETKFVCQRREFRLVVPADGSNEIPRRLKSCQLLSLSLSLFFSLSFSPSLLPLILLPHFPLAIASTSPGNFASQNFARYVPKGNHPCRWRGKEKPGKATRFIKQQSCSPRGIFSCEFFLSLSLSPSLSSSLPLFLYYQQRERKRCLRDHCYLRKLKKAVQMVEKMI